MSGCYLKIKNKPKEVIAQPTTFNSFGELCNEYKL